VAGVDKVQRSVGQGCQQLRIPVLQVPFATAAHQWKQLGILVQAVLAGADVDSVAVKGLYVTRDGLVVRAEALGRARVSVKQQ